MKTKLFTLLLAVAASIGTICAANYSGSCGTDLIWTLNTNDSILNIYGSGAMDDYDYMSSVMSPSPWDSYGRYIKTINCPRGLTSIGSSAFYYCTHLTSVSLSENVTSIGSYAFYGCKGLTSVTIQNSVTSIGDNAFSGCTGLTSVTIGNSVTSIGDNAFSGCTGLTSVTIGNSVTSIGSSAFSGCRGLTSVTIEAETPPTLGSYFSSDITIYVPCGTLGAYVSEWSRYASRISSIPFPYTIGILMKSQGQLLDIRNNVSVVCDDGYKLSAPAYTGYHFVQWDDGITDNPRSVDDVTANTIFTAEYATNYYSLSVICDSNKGSVTPTIGEYAHSSNVVISASPNQGYIFKRWSDNSTDNPRTITMTKDIELFAVFVSECFLKSISVNGEPIAIADTMIFYDEHDDSYIPQIVVAATSSTAKASVSQIDKEHDGWNVTIQVKESNELKKEYKLLIYNNLKIQKTRITLTGGDGTNFSLSYKGDSMGLFVGTTLHQYYNADQHSTFLGYTGYKLGIRPSHVGMIFLSNTLRKGDIVSVLITQESNIGDGDLFFYSDEGVTPITTIHDVYTPGLYSFVLSSDASELNSIYLYRKDMEMNPHVAYLEITRFRLNITYQVQFVDWDGAILKTDSVDYGTAAIAPENPTRPGYTFTGWDKAFDYVTEDMIVTAQYEEMPIYYSHVSIGDLYYNLDAINQTAEVTCQLEWSENNYSGLTIANIPSSVTYNYVTYSVTSIRRYAFSGCSGLTSVTIPNSVICIGDSAFCGCGSIISLTIPNSVTSIGSEAFAGCTDMEYIIIPNSVTTIGSCAFAGCSGLTSVTIGNSVTSIGSSAFSGCSGLTSITSAAVNPPYLADVVFENVDHSIPLYVPLESINAYKSANQWKDFTNILPIGAQPADVTTTMVTASETTADIAWPQVTGAATYELVIKDKNGNVICTLIFNAEGVLISVAFYAPARNNATQQAQAAGFAFTVTGLDSGTNYDVVITSKDSNGSTLDTKTVSFTTTGEAQGIDDVQSDHVQCTTVVRNGQIFILRGEMVYTLQGQEVR